MRSYTFITTDVFPGKFHIYLNPGDDTYIAKTIRFKKKKDKTTAMETIAEAMKDDSYHGFCSAYKGNFVIVVKKFDSSPGAMETLVHEIGHAVFDMADFIGIEYSKSSEEFFTYMQGFLMRKVMEKTKKNPKGGTPSEKSAI